MKNKKYGHFEFYSSNMSVWTSKHSETFRIIFGSFGLSNLSLVMNSELN